MPEFRILGPLEVAAADGEPLQLGGQKQRALLAVLVLHANQVVSTDFLVDALWGDHAPRTATTSLQNSISALRKLLGPDLLVTRAPGYRLVVDPETIDLVRFERLVASARGLEPAERGARLREAVGLWRGDPLAEVAFEPFAVAEARRLEELRLSAFEELFDAELASGNGNVVPELESLVARHPLRERLRGQLMLALYGAGRQADALAAYQDARRMLVEELGLEPGPHLQELHARILRQEVPRPRLAHGGIDDDHFRDVGDALLAARLVPVFGVELETLAAQIAHRFDYPTDESRELTRVAQYVSLTKGAGPLYDELRALLAASAEPTGVHRFFASLPPLLRERGAQHQLLVTTSYDLALEQAFLDAGEQFDVVSYIAAGRDRGRFAHIAPDGTTHVIDLPNTYATQLSLERRTVILKLHGGIDVESFVVTEDDYIAYDVAGAIPVGITAKLSRSHFLFLGYGMRDWSLRLVLTRMVGSNAHPYRSWAVVPQVRPLERQYWRARDVDLLEEPLEDYVDALARYVGAEAPA